MPDLALLQSDRFSKLGSKPQIYYKHLEVLQSFYYVLEIYDQCEIMIELIPDRLL